MNQTVSVVIPYYNGSKVVGEALASVRAQTLKPHEIIVIDDGSRPPEAAVLDQVALPGEQIVHLDRNRGACVARNIGIVRATGTHIALLDCDDIWAPQKLEKQMRFLRDNPSYRAVHTGLKSVDGQGLEFFGHKSEVHFEDLVSFPCPAFPSATILERQALLECGLFNPTKRACQDLDLFLRFTSQYPIGCVDEPLVIRRIQETSISNNFPVFWHEAARVYGDYRYVFKNKEAAAGTLLDVHVEFLQRAIYSRDAKFFWNVLRRATHREASPLQLLYRTGVGLVKNRLAARRQQQPR
jgi:glycosyltransferase involved in cell wall biosynthesis